MLDELSNEFQEKVLFLKVIHFAQTIMPIIYGPQIMGLAIKLLRFLIESSRLMLMNSTRLRQASKSISCLHSYSTKMEQSLPASKKLSGQLKEEFEK